MSVFPIDFQIAHMAHWLVTGGAGFIGSHLVEALVARGHTVRVLDNFSTGRLENLAAVLDRIEVVTGDVRDPCVVREAARGTDVVAHLAAVVSVQASLEDPRTTMAVNVEGTLNVLEAARTAGARVLFASSAAVYGDHTVLPLEEDLSPRPLSPYAASKAAGEALCRAYHAAFGLSTLSLRFFNVYGPRQDPRSPYSGVISIFVDRMQRGLPPVVYGDGLQTRDFVYVADVVEAVIRAGERGRSDGLALNVARGEEIRILDLIALLNGILSTGLEPVFAPPRAGEVYRSAGSPRRLESVLGWRPQVDLKEGLTRLVRETGFRFRADAFDFRAVWGYN
ncbi:MAG: NAD-dependent epimerase/dehydratase family protein [Anaerolineae bacterium]|nr:NAD-dependent epimerase/dehydratase family protein [Anaerolineae bacterium]